MTSVSPAWIFSWTKPAVSASAVPARPPITGIARVDRRTKDLAKRLLPGEIAVIDHEDLDTVATESLIAAGVAAVVNAAPCISGRIETGMNSGGGQPVTEFIVVRRDGKNHAEV